jgi:NADH-quinone oxidoreductase subunit K
MTGMVFATFCMVVSAAEIGMGLALVLLYFRKHGSTSTDDLDLMKG